MPYECFVRSFRIRLTRSTAKSNVKTRISPGSDLGLRFGSQLSKLLDEEPSSLPEECPLLLLAECPPLLEEWPPLDALDIRTASELRTWDLEIVVKCVPKGQMISRARYQMTPPRQREIVKVASIRKSSVRQARIRAALIA